jgi:predicted acetyltransferase
MEETPQLIAEDLPDATKLSLLEAGVEIAHLFIIPFRVRVGQAVVRVDGIGDVWTDEAHRNQGHARRLMEEAVRRMRAGDGALSVLYGIPDFYPKFGYASAGSEQIIVLHELTPGPALPPGWRVRRATPADLPAIQALYDQTTAGVVGAAVREPPGPSWSGRPWAKLAAGLERHDANECRVVETPDGRVAASCWRGADAAWFVAASQEWSPETMAFAEVLAESRDAADAVLGVCCSWAREESAHRERPVTSVTLGVPLDGLVGRSAAFYDARLIASHHRSGGFMVRALDPQRLLTQLLPELRTRLADVQTQVDVLSIATEEGDVTLRRGPDAPMVVTAGDPLAVSAALPQPTLAQLALGAFPPADLLARLDVPPEPSAIELLVRLFPQRRPHIYPPDRP